MELAGRAFFLLAAFLRHSFLDADNKERGFSIACFSSSLSFPSSSFLPLSSALSFGPRKKKEEEEKRRRESRRRQEKEGGSLDLRALLFFWFPHPYRSVLSILPVNFFLVLVLLAFSQQSFFSSAFPI